MALIETHDVTKSYRLGKKITVDALRGVSVVIKKGEYVAIMGPSGSGKSTLMHILGCLDKPSTGSYILNGEDVSKVGKGRLARIRGREIGFVFQSFNLLPRATLLRNVELPMLYAGYGRKERKAKAIAYEEYLKRIGDLAKKVEAGVSDDTPEPLKKSPALRALYNNLGKDEGL